MGDVLLLVGLVLGMILGGLAAMRARPNRPWVSRAERELLVLGNCFLIRLDDGRIETVDPFSVTIITQPSDGHWKSHG